MSLATMDPEALRLWLEDRRLRLIAHRQFVQSYLDRRSRRNVQTRTDVQYQEFQILAGDLLQLLDELIDDLVHQSTSPSSPMPAHYQQALEAWNAGHTSTRSLAQALAISVHQARRLITEMTVHGLI